MNNDHSIRTIRVVTVTTVTRATLERSIGGELHIAFPNWLRNTACDFWSLYR